MNCTTLIQEKENEKSFHLEHIHFEGGSLPKIEISLILYSPLSLEVLVTFSNTCNSSGVSQKERFPPNAITT